MTRVLRNAALLCVAGILMASAALANVPSPGNSTLSSAYLAVEGQTAGQPDLCTDGRCGNWTITVRDLSNNLIAGSSVVIDFSGCPDIQVSCDQLNSVTGQTYLAGKKVSGTTNASGQFVFKAQGASNAVLVAGNVTSAGTNAGIPCAQVYADGVPMGSLIVAAYDVNGTAGVTGADAAVVLAEVVKVGLGGASQARARDDYNNTNTITGGDAAIGLAMVVQAGLNTGTKITAPYCP